MNEVTVNDNGLSLNNSPLVAAYLAACIVGVHHRTIQYAVATGKIQAYSIGPIKAVRLADAIAYAANRRARNGHPKRRPHHTDKGFTFATQKAFDAAQRAARADSTSS